MRLCQLVLEVKVGGSREFNNYNDIQENHVFSGTLKELDLYL
jgi:hypothetical protein